MAKYNQRFEDLSGTVTQTVEQNIEKARGAMDDYFSFFQNIWGHNDLTGKNSLTEQARSLGEAYNKAATDATKPFRMFT